MSSYLVSIRRLCGCCFPIRVTREPSYTLVEVDPRATKIQMLEACVAAPLETWEFDAARRAYGQPPTGEAMEEFFVTGLVMPYVPPGIRVPGEPAIQNPYLDSEEGWAAYRAATDWWELESQLSTVSA